MTNSIHIKIKTLSNLFIGGTPLPFEIGGIDQRTATDQDGFPCIPASSFKGALRAIVREDPSPSAREIEDLFKAYLKREKEEHWSEISNLVKEEEAIQRIKARYEKAEKELSSAYLFGIEGFNQTPKLLFNDLLLCDEFRQNREACFSIDMKNTIDLNGDAPVSNPRTYQTARKGLIFEGEIKFYKIEQLGDGAVALCKEYIIDNLCKLNNGIYRLGNSKSRGYGKVEVSVI